MPSGKSYYLKELTDGPVILEGYLLQDVQATWDSSDWVLTVRQKNGDSHFYESLPGDQSSGNLYLSRTTSEEGRSLYFSYDNSQFITDETMQVCLTGVTDDAGVLLAALDYTHAAGNGTVVTLASDGNLTRQFTFLQENNALVSVTGPTGYEARFTYYDNQGDGGVPMFLLSTVADTDGLYEQVTYSEASDINSGGITLPGNTQIQSTVREYRRAGDLTVTDGSTDYIATYSYDPPGINQYNYLGNPVISNDQVDERSDSLLHYDGPFTYSCTLAEKLTRVAADGSMTVPVNKVTSTTYNKFHSMIQKVVTYDGGLHSVIETLTYAATDGVIDEQVPTYTLPLTHDKLWRYDITSNTESESFCWDNFANLIRRIDKAGIVSERLYYLASGEDGCPADPFGFQRHLKTKIVTPALPSVSGLPEAPVRQQDYRYTVVNGYSGTSLIRRTGMVKSEDAGLTFVLKKTWSWQTDSSLLNAARLMSSSVTLPTSNGDTTTILGFSLENNNATLRTVISRTGFDGLTHKERIDRGVISGKRTATADITLSESAPAVTMDYEYDALDRVTKKTACKGGVFEAAQGFTYTPSSLAVDITRQYGLNINPYIQYVPTTNLIKTSTSARGGQSQSVTDNAGNMLEQRVQDLDGIVSSDTQKFYTVSTARYDGAGNTLVSVSYDYYDQNGTLSTAQSVSLYDEWGEQYATVAPDGHIQTVLHDPLTRITYRSLTGTDGQESQKQRVTEDVSGNALKTERLNTNGSVYSTETAGYDGLGRLVRNTDAMMNVTEIHRDAFDRPVKVIRADGTVQLPEWASHSTSNLMSAIAMAESDDDGADSYTFGTRTFDSLNRVINMTLGGRLSLYTYNDSSARKANTVKTPAGTILTLTYQPELTDAVLSVISDAGSEEAALTFTYDPVTGDVLTSNSDIAKDDYALRSLTYTPSGQLHSNQIRYRLKGDDEAIGNQSMAYSLGGSPVTTADVGGLIHVTTYDEIGRQVGYTLTPDPSSPAETVTAVTFRYNNIGSIDQTTTTAMMSDNVQTTTVTLDAHGREYQRTLDISGTVSTRQVQTLVYDLKDQITTRSSTRDGQLLRTETYEYTPLNQMKSYTCAGDYPDLPDGYRLLGQRFTFDFIGNINNVISDLLDANNNPLTNTATYTSETLDRTQLTRITNDVVTGWDLSLSYDDNGNMTTDEQQRTLNYNSLSQLTNLRDAQGQPLAWFRYDADGLQMAEKGEADTDPTILFYQSAAVLMNELQGTISTTYVNTLASAVRGGNEVETVQLLGCDQQGSVIQICDENEVSWRVYDPYGYGK
ncbi:hypothetical protein [Rahnella aquatilis]|uniref:hypothetical protein n=1 Tax=Rahnella aquatilis TaxID=34038 RepID=UPI000A4DCDC1|nr:hypothetical protein [Rahnella aquatilis]